MASIGRTLFRFGGALLLGASATAIDDPGVLSAPTLAARTPTVSVVVATKDIRAGTVIDRTALAVAQWPVGTQPVGVYGSVDSVANRVTRVAIFKGEALVPGRLAPEGTAAGLEVKITPGKRAFGIRVGGGSDIANMIQPNSRVDVMVIIDEPGQPNRIAKLFMQNMRVLAIGTVAQRGVDGRVTDAVVATLEVTPEEAERLAIAAAQVSLQLAIRGYRDPDSATATVTPIRDLLLRSPRPPAWVAPRRERVAPFSPDTFRVRVYRGVRDSAPDARDATRRP